MIALIALLAAVQQMVADAQVQPETSPTVAIAPTAPAIESMPPSKIVIYRPSSIAGYAIACPVRYHEKEIVELGRGKYAEWPVPPGEYVLTNKTSSVDVNVHPGETRYVRCVIKPGFMSGRADLQMSDRETFDAHAADYKQKEVAPVAP